ncbi:MAG: hypothetical protein V1800_17025 [Candidatus Latescibacterota bacterium]
MPTQPEASKYGFHECIVERIHLKATDFSGADRYGPYKHGESIHSFTVAYGLPQQRFACFCRDRVIASFSLPAFENSHITRSRFLLKLIATWEDWRVEAQPIEIILNDATVYEGELFLENICKGWPARYFPLPLETLRIGENTIEMVHLGAAKNALLIDRAEVMRREDAHDFSIQFSPSLLHKDQVFKVGLTLLDHPAQQIALQFDESLFQFINRSGSEFTFRALEVSPSAKITFRSAAKSCFAEFEVIENHSEYPVFVGIDFDDYRQDDSGETERILVHFAQTEMGNFVAFRPKPGRNTPTHRPASRENWLRWINYCVNNGIYYQFSEVPSAITKEEIVDAGKSYFMGFQYHEPYLIFQPLCVQPDYVREAGTLLERKASYVRCLQERVDALRVEGAQVLCGDPSLLGVYLPETDTDGVLCEPVTNANLQFAMARASGRYFGTHTAVDWYLGYPHNDRQLRRFLLMLDLCYAYGGRIFYAESGAFKINSHDRHDWDDGYCRNLRAVLRDFYQFTLRDTRRGKTATPFALIYGNLESMFWRPDDKLPELVDLGRWDDKIWGEWEGAEYRWLWKAADAWLPCFESEESRTNESLTKLFAGTPFGQVDLIAPTSDLSAYRAVAFLGWNTMTDAIYKNLIAYSRNGGTVFIIGCHFDMRTHPTDSFSLYNEGRVKELIGCNIAGYGHAVFGKYRTGMLCEVACEQISEHLYCHKNGSGKVFFYNFLDSPSDFRLVKDVQSILEGIGREIHSQEAIFISGKDARVICYNVWHHDEGKVTVYLSNVNWDDDEPKSITLTIGNVVHELEIPPAKMMVVQGTCRGFGSGR